MAVITVSFVEGVMLATTRLGLSFLLRVVRKRFFAIVADDDYEQHESKEHHLPLV